MFLDRVRNDYHLFVASFFLAATGLWPMDVHDRQLFWVAIREAPDKLKYLLEGLYNCAVGKLCEPYTSSSKIVSSIWSRLSIGNGTWNLGESYRNFVQEHAGHACRCEIDQAFAQFKSQLARLLAEAAGDPYRPGEHQRTLSKVRSSPASVSQGLEAKSLGGQDVKRQPV